MSFIRTGFRELALKARRQRTRFALKHEKRVLQKAEIALGREGTAEAANFPEVRSEIVALKKLEQEQKEVAVRITKIEEALKEIEKQRQENSREQGIALAKLEEWKRPLVERRNNAALAVQRCDKELATVELRIQESEAADRELMKKLSILEATQPPPPDLQLQMERISVERARIPRERAEMIQARLGSAEACRAAKAKLTAEEELIAQADKNIAKTRGEFESRDRTLSESSRTQDEEVKQARQQHQSVEEKKNPAYLNIGRHLASQGIAPPNAAHLLDNVKHHRAAVDRHQKHKESLATLSAKIDKQELRKFYFTVFSVLALLSIILPLVSQSPPKRDWLPQSTVAIVAFDIDQFNKGPLAVRWRKEQPDVWQKVAGGLLSTAVRAPAIRLAQDIRRVTRALTIPEGEPQKEYVLLETRAALAPVLRKITADTNFTKKTVSGLVIWQGANVTVARVGPKTLAVGSSDEVNHMVEVRLGVRPDLKIDDPLLQRFQELDANSALRLVARTPTDLTTLFAPILPAEFVRATKLFGLELNLTVPGKARLLVRAVDSAKAKELAAGLQKETARWLTIPNSDFALTTQSPKVEQKNEDLVVQFEIPEGAARLLLQRLARIQPAPAP